MVWFIKISGNNDKHKNGKAVSSGYLFPKIIWEAQSGQISSRSVRISRKSQEKPRKSRISSKTPPNPENLEIRDFRDCPYRPLYTGTRDEMPTGGPGLFFWGLQT
jgi:hypothetical protein